MDPNNLEECWFFGNLLETKSKSKSRMVRSMSDPCSSSSGKSYEETYETIKKLESRRRSSNRKSSSKKKSGLARAPSLPTSLESRDDDEEEEEEEEVEFSMGKLIRQASLNTRLPPPPPSQIASNKASASLNRLEIEEVQQGFKELGLIEKEFNVVERRAPPVPRWGGKRAPDEMKAQIKFWARAVASNVRQEC